MSSVKVNGSEMDYKSALDLLSKDTTKVTKLIIGFDNPNKKKDVEPNSEGFEIPKELISELCRAMDSVGAARIKYTLSGSPYIMNRTLILIMEVPKPEPSGVKKLIRKIAKWLMEKSE